MCMAMHGMTWLKISYTYHASHAHHMDMNLLMHTMQSNHCLISGDYGNAARAWRCDPGCIYAMLLSIYFMMNCFIQSRCPSPTYSLAIHPLHFFFHARNSGHKHSEPLVSASAQHCNVKQCSVKLLNLVPCCFFYTVCILILKRLVLNDAGIRWPREHK